ncbi:MAG TPA: amino acid ABC transporter permease, partial [Desulfovibrio sp.]|nr:amino acid ABC transporter permease [Desulfovibrio sp.]
MTKQCKTPVDDANIVIDVGDGAAIPKPSDKGLVSAWRLSFAGAVIVLACLLYFKPDPYLRIFKFVPDGILVTF